MALKNAEKLKLRRAIFRSLRIQGYIVENGDVRLQEDASKDYIRSLHQIAAQHRLEEAGDSLRNREDELLSFIADGKDVHPNAIRPRLVPVANEIDALLFRYVSLHWSVPVSSGYGRRFRFLVFDENNGKLIGIFALGDPVYALTDRDKWIGWDFETKRDRLCHVMDAYVLGAVPPYSSLLCGKLVATLVLSNEVREFFRNRYRGRTSLISRRENKAQLALVTTTSALGRSSLYNRIRVEGIQFWTRIGLTKGYGEFQFSNGLYGAIRDFAVRHCEPTDKNTSFGEGFRNKREIVAKSLRVLGFHSAFRKHGVRREIFAAPLGSDALRFLRGEVNRPRFFDWPVQDLADLALRRWVQPRADRDSSFRDFRRHQYRLWE
ncbi:MAG: Druantia anti-phage system protein DruA [Terriglobales bacterium]